MAWAVDETSLIIGEVVGAEVTVGTTGICTVPLAHCSS